MDVDVPIKVVNIVPKNVQRNLKDVLRNVLLKDVHLRNVARKEAVNLEQVRHADANTRNVQEEAVEVNLEKLAEREKALRNVRQRRNLVNLPRNHANQRNLRNHQRNLRNHQRDAKKELVKDAEILEQRDCLKEIITDAVVPKEVEKLARNRVNLKNLANLPKNLANPRDHQRDAKKELVKDVEILKQRDCLKEIIMDAVVPKEVERLARNLENQGKQERKHQVKKVK